MQYCKSYKMWICWFVYFVSTSSHDGIIKYFSLSMYSQAGAWEQVKYFSLSMYSQAGAWEQVKLWSTIFNSFPMSTLGMHTLILNILYNLYINIHSKAGALERVKGIIGSS